MVFYRTYRPQTIAQLDSPKLREVLTATLSQKNIPHAFLFTGPKGLGKTSTARIIAKILNCTAKKRHGIEPCNECSQCVSITNGSNIDVLEIDGASNRGIDEIRDLREKVNLAPIAARKKVYIIDEVHMLTTEAFNALLKTIEEPPAHVVFIFATTEPQKVPATIISRCFHISLSRATQEEIVHALKRIAEAEKISVTDHVLEKIAGIADGGYRDATKILEELIAIHGKKITEEMFEEMYKTASLLSHVNMLMQHIIQKDAKKSLEQISEVMNQGIDMKFFIFQVLSDLHKRLLEEVKGIQDSKRPKNMQTSLSDLQVLIPLLEVAYKDTKYSPVPSLPLELAVVEYCQDHSKKMPEIPSQQDLHSRVTVNDVLKKEQNLKVRQVLEGTPLRQGSKGQAKELPSNGVQNNLPKDISDTKHLLENLIYKVKPYNHSVAGVLRGCSIIAIDSQHITFQTAYKFHKEKLEEQKTRDILEKVVKEVTGKALQVVVELKK